MTKYFQKEILTFQIDHIECNYSYRFNFIEILDHREKMGAYFQNKCAENILRKLDNLGETKKFLCWFYDNELDQLMSDLDYRELTNECKGCGKHFEISQLREGFCEFCQRFNKKENE